MTPGRFIALWQEWDKTMAAMPRNPSARYGKPQTDALIVAVHETGGDALKIQRRMAEARRAGMDYQAFEFAIGAMS